jgi:hypothetical protein
MASFFADGLTTWQGGCVRACVCVRGGVLTKAGEHRHEGQDRRKGVNKDATIRKRSRQACSEEENIECVALLG